MISQRNPDSAPPPNDGIETWGRRIGRALAWIAAAVLLAHLLWTYGT
jgi:hypothetical protein